MEVDRSLKRSLVLSGCAVFFAAILSGGFPLYLSWRRSHRGELRAEALPVTMRNAEPLIAAIRRYERDRGKPPASLEALIPAYMPRLPDPGPASKRGWRYRTDAGDETGGWSLSIRVRDEYSPNVFGFGDEFVFHPSGKYPRGGYGGMLISRGRFGGWAYYQE